MDDPQIYRWSGACALAAQAIFFIEFPFYLVRDAFPGVTDSSAIAEFTARNATNIMTCVFLDLVILTFLMVFAAGFRHLIRRADPRYESLGALFFGVTVVYVTITLIADSLQGAAAIDARTAPADGSAIRTMMESMYLMYGSVALFLMAVMMVVAGYAAARSQALPKWSSTVAYICALVCLGFVPSMFVGVPDPTEFYNPAGWGPGAIGACFPLTAWMITAGILMMRKGRRVALPIAATVTAASARGAHSGD